jgi:hypothetical protein
MKKPISVTAMPPGRLAAAGPVEQPSGSPAEPPPSTERPSEHPTTTERPAEPVSEVRADPPDDCQLSFSWQQGPGIALSIVYPFSRTIRFQRPVYLSAEALDIDILHVECSDDDGYGTSIDQPVPDKVRFEWTIKSETYVTTTVSPPGQLVYSPPLAGVKGRLETAGGQRGLSVLGDQVLYYPPALLCGDTAYVEIECRAYNTLAAPYHDPDNRKKVDFSLRRHQAAAGNLELRVGNKESDSLNADYDTDTDSDGDCTPSLTWDPGTPIGFWPSEVQIPGELCPGEEAVLHIRGFDPDTLTITCGRDERTLWVNDPVTATWTAGTGTFPCGGIGDYVIYRAPTTPGTDTITCVLNDSGHDAPDAPVTTTFQIKIGFSRLLAQSQQLTKKLEELATKLLANGDFRYQFLQLHSCISNGIMAKASAGGFIDPCWILKLNIRFMERFFEAYNAYEAGQQTNYRWKEAFEMAKMEKEAYAKQGWSQDQAISLVTIAMASAHIFSDLYYSLAEVGCGPRSDFFSIMDIIDDCERSLALGDLMKAYKDMFGSLPVFGNPGNFAIRDWRTAIFSLVCECDDDPIKKLLHGQ